MKDHQPIKSPKSPENKDAKSNNNAQKHKKLSSASQRSLNRKRSQRHLDSQQLRNEGEETESDRLLRDDKQLSMRRDTSTNNMEVENVLRLHKGENSRKDCKSDHSSENRINEASRHSLSLSECQNQNLINDESRRQNCLNIRGRGSIDLSSTEGIIDPNRPMNGLDHFQEFKEGNDHSCKSNFTESNGSILPNRPGNLDGVNVPSLSSSLNIPHQQPDIVSWLPLLSKTTAMPCNHEDEIDKKPFRSNVEIPFVSSSLRKSVKKNASFNCDDIASPKLAARHAMRLEQAAAKQAALEERKRTPSFCFNVSASETSDNECQNQMPLL